MGESATTEAPATEAATTQAPTTEATTTEAATTEASASAGFQVVIDVEMSRDGGDKADVHVYTDRENFNKMAWNSTYIRYKTNKIGTAVYKRKTDWNGLDAYELFLNMWSIKDGNKFHEDFDIYSSYDDAVADRNPWQYCNGDDKGVGFPRDCDPKKHRNWTWFAFPKSNQTPAYVDFHPRFDIKYLHGKCYHRATFEIFPNDLESPVEEITTSAPAESEAEEVTTSAPTTT